MQAQNAKRKMNSQLQNTFRFRSSEKRSVIGCSFYALHLVLAWDSTNPIEISPHLYRSVRPGKTCKTIRRARVSTGQNGCVLAVDWQKCPRS